MSTFLVVVVVVASCSWEAIETRIQGNYIDDPLEAHVTSGSVSFVDNVSIFLDAAHDVKAQRLGNTTRRKEHGLSSPTDPRISEQIFKAGAYGSDGSVEKTHIHVGPDIEYRLKVTASGCYSLLEHMYPMVMSAAEIWAKAHGSGPNAVLIGLMAVSCGTVLAMALMYAYPNMVSTGSVGTKKAVSKNGKLRYEWSQTEKEITIFLVVPRGVDRSNLEVGMSPWGVKMSKKGKQRPFLKEEFWSAVSPDGSSWKFRKDRIVEVVFAKVDPEMWDMVFQEQDGVITNVLKPCKIMSKRKGKGPSAYMSGDEFDPTLTSPGYSSATTANF